MHLQNVMDDDNVSIATPQKEDEFESIVQREMMYLQAKEEAARRFSEQKQKRMAEENVVLRNFALALRVEIVTERAVTELKTNYEDMKIIGKWLREIGNARLAVGKRPMQWLELEKLVGVTFPPKPSIEEFFKLMGWEQHLPERLSQAPQG